MFNKTLQILEGLGFLFADIIANHNLNYHNILCLKIKCSLVLLTNGFCLRKATKTCTCSVLIRATSSENILES